MLGLQERDFLCAERDVAGWLLAFGVAELLDFGGLFGLSLDGVMLLRVVAVMIDFVEVSGT